MSKEKILNKEDVELEERIILNGKVDYVETGDEQNNTIGIVLMNKIKTFSGETVISNNYGFPLSKEMENKLNWKNCYASVKFVTCDTPIDVEHIEEKIIESYYGLCETQYRHRYSDYTGYLWTDEEFKVGGHDLIKILESHEGEYIHLEIELYKEKKPNR